MKTAAILAAGRGTKIWPFGGTKPKAILPVATRPIVEHQVTALRALGFSQIIIVTGYLGNQIRGLARLQGDDVRFVEQEEATGTAHALMKAFDLAEGDLLVLYGDIATAPENLQKLVEEYQGKKPAAAVMVDRLAREAPGDWICARVLSGLVEEFLGHPRDSVTHRLGGIFALSADARPYIARNPGLMSQVQVGMMPPMEAELAQSLQLMLDEGKQVVAVETEGYLVDVDKPWHILEATIKTLGLRATRLTDSIVPDSSSVSDQAEIEGHVVLGENTHIGRRVVVKGSLWVGDNTVIENGAILGPHVAIGNNCDIRDYCNIGPFTAIGDRCHIGHCAEVAGVIMDNVYAVHYLEFWGVIGSSSDLAAATVCGNLRFDDAAKLHTVKGHRESDHLGSNAAYMGDFVRTGVNAIIMPGCKIGPYSVVGPGVVLMEDLPGRTIIMPKQELTTREWGPERYGW